MTPFEEFASDYQGKRVLIFGLGLQGRGIGDTKIFASIGAQVRVTDAKTAEQLQSAIDQLQGLDIEYRLGGTTKEDIEWAQVIIRNASVPWHHELLEHARSRNIPIKMDAALFFKYAQPKKSIAVTGTRGKSTTTHLIFKLLKDNSHEAVMGGNGVPIASLELLKDFDPQLWYVFELSSWQLQAFHQEKVSPHIGVFTNLYPDHLLDRTFEEYRHDKTAIFAYQDENDYLIINSENPHTYSLSESAKSKVYPFSKADWPKELEAKLLGAHNRENLAAAYQVLKILCLDSPKALQEFDGLPFRQQLIATIDGVQIINDTTSTTPIAAVKALETFPQSIVITGGTTKKLPIDELISALSDHSKHIILLEGSGTQEIKSQLDSSLVAGEHSDLGEALNQAWSLASRGDTILFTPAFTSFGLFTNEFHRGEVFNSLVAELINHHETKS